MAHIIISYSSKDRDRVVALAGDLEALGHEVWSDTELTRTGGQKWWSNILANIRQCDLFVFALTPNSLTSEPCKREYGYAHALRKRILPVMLESIDVAALAAPLQEIEFVDYREHSTKQALALAATLNNLPPAQALPDPLPPEPETPLPLLAQVAERLEASSLNGSEQVAIVFELERLLNDPTTRTSAEALLRTLYGREDLTNRVGDKIRTIIPDISEGQPRPPAPMVEPQEKEPEGRATTPPAQPIPTKMQSKPDNEKQKATRVSQPTRASRQALLWTFGGIVILAIIVFVAIGILLPAFPHPTTPGITLDLYQFYVDDIKKLKPDAPVTADTLRQIGEKIPPQAPCYADTGLAPFQSNWTSLDAPPKTLYVHQGGYAYVSWGKGTITGDSLSFDYADRADNDYLILIIGKPGISSGADQSSVLEAV